MLAQRVGPALIGLGYSTCALGAFEASDRYLQAALQTAVEIGVLWMVMDGLVGLTRLLTARDPGEAAAGEAAELLAFVLQHPASSQEARDRAPVLLPSWKGGYRRRRWQPPEHAVRRVIWRGSQEIIPS